ncbi:putative MFS transporter [Kocuria sp. AG109]|nr:putative MFS transporter [Kocuria sp. AG109]
MPSTPSSSDHPGQPADPEPLRPASRGPAGSREIDAFAQIDAAALTGRQRSLILLAVLANTAEFFDMFLIGFIVSDLTKPWGLTFWQSALVLLASGVGTMIGAILWGRVSDVIGRRRTLVATVLIFTVFTGLSVLTPDGGWALLVGLRLLVGIGVGGLNIVSIPWIQEFVPASRRGWLSGLASVFIPVGLLLGSVSTWLLLEPLTWRGLMALGATPILLVVWILRVPESPRFLAARGRQDQARAAVAWALRLPVEQVAPVPAGEPEPERPAPYREILTRHRWVLAIVAVGTFCFVTGSVTVQSWGQTLLVQVQGITPAQAARWFIGISLASLVGRLAAARLADVVGRRPVLLVCGLGGAAASLWAAHAGSAQLGPVGVFYLAMAAIMLFGDGAFGILNAYGAELFPTPVRASGLGLGYGLGASGKVVGPMLLALVSGSGNLVSPAATQAAIVPAFTIMGALLGLGGLIYLLARETAGTRL